MNIIDLKRSTRLTGGRGDEVLNITKYISIRTVKGFVLWVGSMLFVSYTILKVSGLL